MQIPAVLWDGFKKINGFLTMEQEHLVFEMTDFHQTSLKWVVAIDAITEVKPYHLFQKELNGIEFISMNGESNVFILEESLQVMNRVKNRLNLNKIG